MLISLPIGLKCITQTKPTEAVSLNPLQFLAIIVGLAGMILSLNQGGVAVSEGVSGEPWGRSAAIAIVSLAVGVAALVFFVWSSRRSFSPLIRLGWLKDKVVMLHLIPYTLLPMVGIGFGYVITNLAQLSLGTSALVAGMLVLPGPSSARSLRRLAACCTTSTVTKPILGHSPAALAPWCYS